MKEDKTKEVILRARQSAVSKAGNDWESYVENFLKESLREIKDAYLFQSDLALRWLLIQYGFFKLALKSAKDSRWKILYNLSLIHI